MRIVDDVEYDEGVDVVDVVVKRVLSTGEANGTRLGGLAGTVDLDLLRGEKASAL
jgi:hypothetical protein